ncbi:MAG: hypothetical protein ISS70_21065 [Phycisphaerae bacterium]|nr:hypothetical protein [Phycisphaerae bacterium]
MKDEHSENWPLENLLTRAHVPEPSPQLKQRITAEARKAWDQTSADIPWQIPLRRLVASAAAAVLIIWLANFSSDYTLAQWRPGSACVATQQPTDFDMLPEMPYGPFAKHMVLVDRRSRVIDASALSDYVESVRRLLDETEQNGVSTPLAPPGGSSRLAPGRADARSYS